MCVETIATPHKFVHDPEVESPSEAVVFEQEIRPSGQWHLDFGAQSLTASFSIPAVTSLIVERDDTRNRLALDLRSEIVRLEPEESLTIEQKYRRSCSH